MNDIFCKFTQFWHDLCYVLNFFLHVPRMGERRMAHRIWGGGERKRSLGRIGVCVWEDLIKVDLQ